jgi:antitoxin YefM
VADAKADLPEMVSRVSKHHQGATITVHGQPSAVLPFPAGRATLEEHVTLWG